MKNDTTCTKSRELTARAAQVISKLAGSQQVTTQETARDQLTNGDAVFLFTGYSTAEPNGKAFQVVLNTAGKELKREDLEKSEKRSLFLPPVPEVSKELLLPFAVAAGDIKISPTENKLTLDECKRFNEVITVTIPKDSRRKVDIYFLADTTGSMTDFIAAVKAGANNILTAVNATGNDLVYGVGNYRDFTDPAPYPFQHQLNPTASAAAVTAAINTWTANGGGDDPEAQLFALSQLAQAPGGSIGWRPDSKRIIVWFGDQPGHDPSGAATLASTLAQLQAQNISVIAISVGANQLNATGQAVAIASGTGGSFQAGINATNIVNTIIALINSLVSVINNVSLVPAGSTAPFVTLIDPPGGYGPLKGDREHVLTFHVTFTGVRPCAEKDQVFHGSLDVVADGVVVAQKKVEVRVPACCRRRRYSYSVKYVIGRQDREDCASRMPVNPGTYTTEINIHNYQLKEALIEKRLVPLILQGEPVGREPRFSGVLATDKIVLPPYAATMDDTFRLNELIYKNAPPCNTPLNVGFLHILSNVELAVTAVYTAADNKTSEVLSLEVEEITVHEVPVDSDIRVPTPIP